MKTQARHQKIRQVEHRIETLGEEIKTLQAAFDSKPCRKTAIPLSDAKAEWRNLREQARDLCWPEAQLALAKKIAEHILLTREL